MATLVPTLAPTASVVFYLFGVLVNQMLDDSFQDVFVTRDFFSDALILHIMRMERGGAMALALSARTSQGVATFVGEFQRLRASLLMSLREMLVYCDGDAAHSAGAAAQALSAYHRF